jgi:hypothetical protein
VRRGLAVAACVLSALAAGAARADAAPAGTPTTTPAAPAAALDPLIPSHGHLVNQHSFLGAAVLNARQDNNAPVIQYRVSPEAPNNDYFFFEQLGTGNVYYIRPLHTGKCLTVQNASTANNARVIQYDCVDNGVANEVWEPVHVQISGQYLGMYWQNLNSGKCLTVLNASRTNGAALIQYDCRGWSTAPYNELWKITE